MAAIIQLFPLHTASSASEPRLPTQQAPRRVLSGKALPKFLAVRNGIYYFKRKIPANLVAEFGNQSQIWKSLKTSNLSQATRALSIEVATFELRATTTKLRMASEGIVVGSIGKMQPLRAEMIPALTQRYYVHMLDKEQLNVGISSPLEPAELANRKREADEALQYYQNATIQNDLSVVEETLGQLLRGEGLSADRDSVLRGQFAEQLLITEVAVLHEQRARLDGNKKATPLSPLAIRLQPTLLDYLETWKDQKRRPMKTVETTTRMVNMYNTMMGELPASLITFTDVVAFRDKLVDINLSAETIRNRLGLLRAVVNSYFVEKKMQGANNPFDKVPRKDKGQRVRVEKDRRAFEIPELNRMYGSPLFVERDVPTGQSKEGSFWAPLMGPFVGARIEELAQMSLNDIEIINGVWTLRICDLDLETQTLKNKNSFRRVPIHAELIQLGFLRYVCDQRRAGETRLFPSLKCDNKYKKWSNALGKWFGRYLHTIGLTSPQLDYHSFRYNFRQRLTQCGVADEVRDALTGHWLTKDSGGKPYMRAENRQYSFPSLCNAMEALRYDELNLSTLYVADPLKDVDNSLFLGASR